MASREKRNERSLSVGTRQGGYREACRTREWMKLSLFRNSEWKTVLKMIMVSWVPLQHYLR